MRIATYGHERTSELAPRRSALELWWNSIDRLSLGLFVLIAIVGVGMSLAASPSLAQGNGVSMFHYTGRQLVFAASALTIAPLLSMLHRKAMIKIAAMLCAVATIALLGLPFFGTDFGKGAIRWYSVAGFSVQPSEFVKPALIVCLGSIISYFQSKNDGHKGRGELWAFLLLSLILVLLWIQPDHGQMALLFLCFIPILFVAGTRLRFIITFMVVALIVGLMAYFSSENVRERIGMMLADKPEPYSQIEMSLRAFDAGGITGVGPGAGTVKHSLPDAYSDFVLAVAAEEFGAISVFVIMGLFVAVILRCLWRLSDSSDATSRIVGAGLVSLIGIQALVNICVAVGLAPPTGMTLPLISYGGSSIIASGFAIGWLLVCTRERERSVFEEALER